MGQSPHWGLPAPKVWLEIAIYEIVPCVNKKAQLSLTNPRDAKPAKIAPIRRAYNVVANNTGLSSCV